MGATACLADFNPARFDRSRFTSAAVHYVVLFTREWDANKCDFAERLEDVPPRCNSCRRPTNDWWSTGIDCWPGGGTRAFAIRARGRDGFTSCGSRCMLRRAPPRLRVTHVTRALSASSVNACRGCRLDGKLFKRARGLSQRGLQGVGRFPCCPSVASRQIIRAGDVV